MDLAGIILPTQPLPLTSSQPLTTKSSQAQIIQGKKKVDWDDSTPWKDTSASIEQVRELEEGLEPSFGFQTPFKKGTHFFNPSSSAYFSTPGSMFTPDVRVGLVTPSRTELGENIMEYNTNQGTHSLTVTRQAVSSAQTTMTALTNNSVAKSGNPLSTDDLNGTTHISFNRGGGNDPPRSRGGGPPYPGGGDSPPNQGGRNGPPPQMPQFNSSPIGGGGRGDPGGDGR